jgi:hypothetical protein
MADTRGAAISARPDARVQAPWSWHAARPARALEIAREPTDQADARAVLARTRHGAASEWLAERPPEDDARHGRQAASGRSRAEATVQCSQIHDVIFARRSPSGFSFA